MRNLVTFQLFEATFTTRVFLLVAVTMVAWVALACLASRMTRLTRKTPMRSPRMVAMGGLVASCCSSFTLCSCFLYSRPLTSIEMLKCWMYWMFKEAIEKLIDRGTVRFRFIEETSLD